MNKEIEVKVKVASYAAVRRKLSKAAKFVKAVEQVDEYWTPAHKNIYIDKSGEYWRVRRSAGKVSFEYHRLVKNKKGIKLYAAEYETKVESGKILQKILKFIDAQLILVVRKKREYFKTSKFEFCLDRVVGLGNFLEIENLKVGKNYALALKECWAQLEALGISYSPEKQANYFDQAFRKKRV